MAETYNLIQTLQKLRDDLKLWSSNNFRNVLSKLSSHEGSTEAHKTLFDAVKIVVDTTMDVDSNNPVANRIVKQYIDDAISGVSGSIGSSGDMYKSTYDTNADGTVDKSESLNKTVNSGIGQAYNSLEFNWNQGLTYKAVDSTAAEPINKTETIAFVSHLDSYMKVSDYSNSIQTNTNNIAALTPRVTSVENKTQNIQDDTTSSVFGIQDESGNIAFQVNNDGAVVNQITTNDITLNHVKTDGTNITYNLGSEIEQLRKSNGGGGSGTTTNTSDIGFTLESLDSITEAQATSFCNMLATITDNLTGDIDTTLFNNLWLHLMVSVAQTNHYKMTGYSVVDDKPMQYSLFFALENGGSFTISADGGRIVSVSKYTPN